MEKSRKKGGDEKVFIQGEKAYRTSITLFAFLSKGWVNTMR
jgi:hypothetical protein